MYVCVYVCMCVCMYVCMYVCVCVCILFTHFLHITTTSMDMCFLYWDAPSGKFLAQSLHFFHTYFTWKFNMHMKFSLWNAGEKHLQSMWKRLTLLYLLPLNISTCMYIHLNVLYTFPVGPTRRICSTIKRFLSS